MKRSLGLAFARVGWGTPLAIVPIGLPDMPAAAALRFALTAAHRRIERVHHHFAHVRTTFLPQRAPSLPLATCMYRSVQPGLFGETVL